MDKKYSIQISNSNNPYIVVMDSQTVIGWTQKGMAHSRELASLYLSSIENHTYAVPGNSDAMTIKRREFGIHCSECADWRNRKAALFHYGEFSGHIVLPGATDKQIKAFSK